MPKSKSIAMLAAAAAVVGALATGAAQARTYCQICGYVTVCTTIELPYVGAFEFCTQQKQCREFPCPPNITMPA